MFGFQRFQPRFGFQHSRWGQQQQYQSPYYGYGQSYGQQYYGQQHYHHPQGYQYYQHGNYYTPTQRVAPAGLVSRQYASDPTWTDSTGKVHYLHPDGIYRLKPAGAPVSKGVPIIHRSPFSDVEIPEGISLTDFVFADVGESEETAIVDGASDRSYSFKTLRGLIKKIGSALTRKGFKKGDCLAILLPNCPEFPIIFHAVASLGGITSPINPAYTEHSIAHQLKDSNATFIVTVGPFLDNAKKACEESGQPIKDIIVIGEEAEGTTNFKELCADDGSAFPIVTIDPRNDIVALPYSSGTTGLPKGVMLTHQTIIANLCQMSHEKLLSLNSEDCMIAVLPFFHIYGLVVLLNSALRQGCKLVCMPRFVPQDFLALIQKHKVTVAPVVPPIVLFLAKHPLVDKYDLSSLKEVFSGAAPLGKELTQMCKDRLKIPHLRQGYGMTEMSPVSHIAAKGQDAPGSCGVLVPNLELKLVDVSTGECVGTNKEGELWIRGPNNMIGYLNNAEATANTIDAEGFLHTGDVGYVDDDGNYFIVDRVKELIKYKGFQVAPAELEALLQGHPAISDAAVIPIPDDDAGELPMAYLVKKEGAEVTAEEVMDFVAGKVETYKRIRKVEFISEVPKSASGKILRRVLKDRHAEDSKTVKIDCEAKTASQAGEVTSNTAGIVNFRASSPLPAPTVFVLSPWAEAMEGVQVDGQQVEDSTDVIVEVADGKATVTISGDVAEKISRGAVVTFIDYFR